MSTPWVRIEAPARLHLGVLDLGGRLGRRFGGIGAAVPAPSLLLEAERAERFHAEGPDADRALAFAARFAEQFPQAVPARLIVRRAIPGHSGLGSGTQLGLAVATALARLAGVEADAPTLARAVGRGVRSAIGTWAFAQGGFLLEGGRRPGSASVAPLLLRHPMPSAWRVVVAVPHGPRGLSGDAEVAAFRALPPAPDRQVAEVAHLVLMQLLPALVEGDLPSFGSALTAIQRITGGWFAAAQGGPYAPGPTAELIEVLQEAGAHGVGQSSWGPAVYALAGDDRATEELAAVVQRRLGGAGTIYVGAFSVRGATVESATPATDRQPPLTRGVMQG